jgi:hypothetical protein
MNPEINAKIKNLVLILTEKKNSRKHLSWADDTDIGWYSYKATDIDNNVYNMLDWREDLGKVGDKITLNKGYINNKITKQDGSVEWGIQTGSRKKGMPAVEWWSRYEDKQWRKIEKQEQECKKRKEQG